MLFVYGQMIMTRLFSAIELTDIFRTSYAKQSVTNGFKTLFMERAASKSFVSLKDNQDFLFDTLESLL